jgi:hypothetical protein
MSLWVVIAFILVNGQGYFWISPSTSDFQSCDRQAAAILENIKANHAEGLQTAAAQCVPLTHRPGPEEAGG